MIRYMEFPRRRRISCILLLLFSTSLSFLLHCALSDDADTLLSLKSEFDNLNHLQWRHGSDPCQWKGVKQCLKGRVIKLVLEHLNLTGQLNVNILNQLDQLRLLSFKANSLTGQIPDLSGLANLKSIYLNGNHFSGQIPASLSVLHRLKVIVLSDNRISGEIPNSLLDLRRLYVLSLDNNELTGEIPPFNQTSLRFFNVSNNLLHGEIPMTSAMVRFSVSSFFGNIGLCGRQIESQCDLMSPSRSPSSPIKEEKKKHGLNLNRRQITAVVVGSVGGLALLILCFIIMCVVCKRSGRTTTTITAEGNNNGNGGGGGKQFSWEETGEGGGSENLVFLVGEGLGEERMSYNMEDLLKASAETLGRGTVGSTYKAVMESGYIVTVKRLRDARYPRVEEFRRYMDILGRFRHPNLVPIRAYFQAKEERLLVYDYFPNGSLFALIHGSRAPPGGGGGKPLHWTSCLKIAEDVAAGLLYIHQNPNLITHGNLKSSNVLLGSDFESCLTDYGLSSFKNPDDVTTVESNGGVFYKAPECRHMTTTTQEGDVYSFGVLLLELLTGKTPIEDVVEEHGSDIPKWVRSVREDHETESGDGAPNEDKLGALLSIAMACVSVCSDGRPGIKEALRMVREARAEAHVSSKSNSSDHSPGRWSDTVQSLPREDHQHLSI